MSFEADMRRLTGIIEELGRDDVELDRAMTLYQEGVEKLRSANAALSRAEAQVKVLIEGDGGSFELADFRA